jgi:predicted kinase
MRTLILLCGRPFSGKSTLAGRLSTDPGTAVVSFDAINLERGLRGGDGVPVAEWARTLEIAKERAATLLAEYPRVVIDDTLCFRWLRDAFRDLARAAGARCVLVYLDPPQEVLQQRMAANAHTGARSGIDAAVLAEHLATFELPGTDEDPIVLRSSAESDAWLAALDA